MGVLQKLAGMIQATNATQPKAVVALFTLARGVERVIYDDTGLAARLLMLLLPMCFSFWAPQHQQPGSQPSDLMNDSLHAPGQHERRYNGLGLRRVRGLNHAS